jgi:hypothetical protein
MSQEPRREQHAGAPPATVPWSSVVVGRTDEVDAQAWLQRHRGRACAPVALREDPSALDATLIEVTRARRSGSAAWQGMWRSPGTRRARSGGHPDDRGHVRR